MYSRSTLIRVLKRDLRAELRAIRFYANNIEKLNYRENKKRIDELALGSIRHAEILMKRLLALEKGSGCTLTKKMMRRALKEETALRELYAFELMRIDNPDVLKAVNTLIKEETRHKETVRSLQ